MARYNALEDELVELRAKSEKQDQIRDDMNAQIRSMTEKKNKADKRCDDLSKRCRDLEELDHRKDQKLQDMEFDFKSQRKEFEKMMGELQVHADRGEKEQEKLNKILDEKEMVIAAMKRAEK